MNKDDLVAKVKKAVLEIEPSAEIYLFGSRSRGDSQTDSDWDFLILLDGPVDGQRTDRVRHRLYEIEWEVNEVISSLVWNKIKWDEEPYRQMPLHDNIEREGIRL